MKKLLLPLIFLLLVMPGLSQGWVFVNGTVTSQQDSLPVVNHPVTIFADSLNGVIYFNIVYTDSEGHYSDMPPVMTNSTGMLTIQTPDCNNNLQQVFFNYDSANTVFTHDFRICTSTPDCDAYFTYYEVTELTFQFQDMSIGNPQTWNWEFGDGVTSSEQNPLHYYNAGGWYNVTLTIGNEPAGCTDSYSSEIYVADSSGWICQAFYSFSLSPRARLILFSSLICRPVLLIHGFGISEMALFRRSKTLIIFFPAREPLKHAFWSLGITAPTLIAILLLSAIQFTSKSTGRSSAAISQCSRVQSCFLRKIPVAVIIRCGKAQLLIQTAFITFPSSRKGPT